MNVPKGYKMTEVGVIPEDWEVCRIGDIANVTRGASPRPIDSPIWFDDSSLVGWVRISDVTRSSKFLEETTQKLSMLGIKQSRFVKQNSLIMSICATVGRPILTKIDVCIHDGFVVFSNLDLEEEYLYYLLLSIEKDWSKNGQIGSQMNLNTELINSTLIPIPKNRREQRSIAQVLSDTDELINALDKLIAKKRDIKKAVMQELLTGKTRLPGFSGKWEVKKLGDIGNFRGGNSFPTIYQGNIEGCYPFFKVSDMNNNGNEIFMISANNYISELTQKKLCITVFPKGSIVFAKVGVAIFHERKKILSQPSCIDNNMMAFILNTNLVDTRFIHTMLHLKRFGCYVSTTALPSLSGKQLSEITILLPPISEQQAIAQVLSDMDREITVLEQRRDKTKALKQGMMQALLTGRIRLPKEDTNDSI